MYAPSALAFGRTLLHLIVSTNLQLDANSLETISKLMRNGTYKVDKQSWDYVGLRSIKVIECKHQ